MRQLQPASDSAGLTSTQPTLLAWFALGPLLAMSDSLVHAMALGLCALAVLVVTCLVLGPLRQRLQPVLRLPAAALLLACLVGCIDLLLQAFAVGLHESLGPSVPLVVPTCLLLSQRIWLAPETDIRELLQDTLLTTARCLLVLVLLGATRELLGTGALLAGFEQLLHVEPIPVLSLFPAEPAFLLAVLPPGAFLLLGVLLALRNLLVACWPTKDLQTGSQVAGSKRVRVTGKPS